MAMSVQGYPAKTSQSQGTAILNSPPVLKAISTAPLDFFVIPKESGNLTVTWDWSMLQP